MKLPGLRAARDAARLTQSELAQKAGITAQTVSNIETGDFTRCSTARKLAKALGVKVEILEREARAV